MERLLKAAEVAVMLDLGTLTVVKRARAGKIPGALLIKAPRGGALGYAYFRPDLIRAWLEAGCPAVELERPAAFTLRRHAAHSHAGGRARNDQNAHVDYGLAALVKAAHIVRTPIACGNQSSTGK